MIAPPRHGAARPFRDRAIERTLAEAAEIGVGVLKKYYGRLRSVEKKGAIDFVTRADIEAEALVIEYIRRRHPDHAIIAEESWKGPDVMPGGFAWVLDPLDGTTNFAHGLAHHALSLGVVYDGEPVAGRVVDPQRDLVYRAAAGRGAWRNRTRLRISEPARLADCLLGTGFPYDRSKHIGELMAVYGAFLARTHGVRRMGVASLDLVMTAAGQLDGFYEPHLHAWDVAAGMLLITEAGGKITDYDGRPFNPFSRSMVAGSPRIHRAMLRLIRQTLKEHRTGASDETG